MRVSNDEWSSRKGTVAFSVEPKGHQIDIWVSCTKPVSVYGVSKDQETLLKAGSEFRFRKKVRGYLKVRIKGTGQTAFGLKVVERPLSEIDYNSGEKAPVVELPEPSNLVARFRAIARAHHQGNSMPVLEPEDGPSFGRYEVDDEAEIMFEEEAWQKRQEERKVAARKAKEAEARKDAEAPAADTHEPPKTQDKSEAPPIDPPAKAAE